MGWTEHDKRQNSGLDLPFNFLTYYKINVRTTVVMYEYRLRKQK